MFQHGAQGQVTHDDAPRPFCWPLQTYENMLAHPPFDKNEVAGNGQPFYLLHLTYPIRFNSTGEAVRLELSKARLLQQLYAREYLSLPSLMLPH